ncbi:hypothetical protein D3C76_818420 [compost metagenome]
MQEVDLELAGAHFVHEGVALQADGIHAAVDVFPERPQAVVGRHAERRMTQLAAAIQAQRCLEFLGRIGVGREDEEFQFGRHHRLPAVGGIAGDDLLEQAAGGQAGRRTIQLLRIADGEGTRSIAPGQDVNLGRIGDQRQVAVIGAVEARRRVAAHDALQQHTTRQLQATAGEEAVAGHHFASRHSVQVGSDAFDLFDSSQPFGNLAAPIGSHDSYPCRYGAAHGGGAYKIRIMCSEFQALDGQSQRNRRRKATERSWRTPQYTSGTSISGGI